MTRYRYVFLAHPDDDRAVAAFELFAESVEGAQRFAQDCLQKSHARLVEVWSDGRLVVRVTRVLAAA